MAGFIYYVGRPGVLTLDDVQQMGLRYAFDHAPSCAGVAGPDGKRGTVFAAADRQSSPPIGYSAKTQQWRRSPSAGKDPAAQVWVGMVMNDPPTPSILERPKMIPGHQVEMADGNQWTVPLVRRYLESGGEVGWDIALPQVLDYDENGQFVEGGVLKQHEHLWALAERFADHLVGMLETAEGEEITLDVQAHVKDAVTALQANYHVAATELAMLKALMFDAATDVMLSLIDWRHYQDLMSKKKHSDALSSELGNSADTQNTAQPLAS